MSTRWYVHIGGESFGPLTTEVVTVMLRQTRLQFSDFVWHPGQAKWMRIGEVDTFATLLPPYPKVGVPKTDEFGDELTPKPKLASAPPKEIGIPRSGQVEPSAKETKKEKGPPTISAFPRVLLAGKIKLSSGESFKIVDISEGGVYVAAKNPIDIGTELRFELEAEEIPEKLAMGGVVIRHGDRNQHAGFAIEFMRVNPAYKRLLQTYISNELNKR